MHIYNPENLELDKLFKGVCHPDYARMFIHILVKKSYKSKSKFIPLKASLLRLQVHAKKTETIKTILINNGIIECDNKYCPKMKCLGYRLTEKYQCKVARIKLQNTHLVKRLRENLPCLVNPVHKALLHWLNQVEIDYLKASFLLAKTNNNLTKSLMLEKLYSKDFFFSIDQRGRVYHNVSCLWSKLRQFLSINKEKLVNVDIKNSQPLLFCILLKQYISNIISTKYDEPPPPDVRLFVEQTEAGTLYDCLMKQFSFESRNSFKKKFFAEVFYSKLGIETELTRKFNFLFPTVAKAINYYKQNDYRNVPLQMQQIEADLIIGKVCTILAEQDIPFLTIHDSILTTTPHVNTVKTIMKDAFADVGLSPSFGI